MAKSLALLSIRFKRHKTSKWETGWGLSKVNDGADLSEIYDGDYKRLRQVPFDFRNDLTAKAEIIPGGIGIIIEDEVKSAKIGG